MRATKKKFKNSNGPLCFLESWDGQEASITCIKGGRTSGKVFASGWDDKKVRVFMLGSKPVPKPLMELDGLDSQVTGLEFNQTEEVLAGGDEKGSVTMWSLKQGKVARTLDGGTKSVTEIAFHPTGAFAAVAGQELTTRVWDLREKKCIQTYSAHEKTTALAFSPGSGGLIVSGGDSGLVKLWDVRAGKVVATLKKHAGAVRGIAFHPTELTMATSGDDGCVQFWSLDDYSKLASSGNYKEPVRGISFSSDGRAALAVSDTTLRVMSWKPYALLDSVNNMQWGGAAPVRDAFIRRDKLFVSTASKDGHVPHALILGLSSGIRPFASDAENVAPVVVEVAPVAKPQNPPEDVKPEQPEVVVAPAPEPTPVVAAPAPVVVAVEEEKQAPPPAVEVKQEKVSSKQAPLPPPPAPVVAASVEAPKKGSRTERSSSSSGGGSQRQKKKDSTKPSQTIIPAAHVGIVPSERTAALGLKAEEFRTKSKNAKTDDEMIDFIMEEHAQMCATLSTRKAHVAAIRAMWNKDSIWKAISQMKEARELSVVYDVFQNMSSQGLQVVPLELLNVVLMEVQCLLQSEYEDYCVLGCSMIRGINKIFCGSLKATKDKAAEAKSDPVLAERLELTNLCWDTLGKCAQQLKENMSCGGRVGSASREVLALLRRVGINA